MKKLSFIIRPLLASSGERNKEGKRQWGGVGGRAGDESERVGPAGRGRGEMCSGSEAGSYLRLTCAALNSKRESDQDEEKGRGGREPARVGPAMKPIPSSVNASVTCAERDFFIDNLLVRIHFIIEMIWWTGLAPREFEFPFAGSLVSTFLLGRTPINSRLKGRVGPVSIVIKKKNTYSGGHTYVP